MLEKQPFVKPSEFRQRCVTVQKTICWPNLGRALRLAVRRCHSRSRIHSEADTGSSCSAMSQHYLTSAAAALRLSGSSFSVSAMLLIYTYSLLPARALSKCCCLYCACCRRETKSVVEVLDDSAAVL